MKIDPTICEHYYAYLNDWCALIGFKCNPNHEKCKHADEKELGIPEDLMEEK